MMRWLQPIASLGLSRRMRARYSWGGTVSHSRTGARSGGRRAGRCPGRVAPMNDVTRILSAIEQGDPEAAEQLLPLVYDELRALAARKLAQEKPGQTLQATALVHEAYLRLVGSGDPGW